MNGDHAFCAFLLWEEAARRKQTEMQVYEEETRRKQAEMQVAALQQEIERLKKVDQDADVPATTN